MMMKMSFSCGSFSWAPLLISWVLSRPPPLLPPTRRPQTRMSSPGRSPLLSSCPEGASFLCQETLCHLYSTSAFPSAASIAWPTPFLSPDCDLVTWIDLEIWIGDLCLVAIEISSRGPAMASDALRLSSPKSLSPPDHIFRQRDGSEPAGRLGRCTRTPMTLWAAAWTGQAFRLLPQISWTPGPPPCLLLSAA